MTVGEITTYLEQIAPLSLQESYDNAGLIIGNPSMEVTGVLTSLDATENVIEEAIEKQCNLIVAHHPILFFGLKRLNGSSYVERTLIKAIKNDIALYAIHTNLDNVAHGVNAKICQILDIENPKILAPGKNAMLKLVTYVPIEATEKVSRALSNAGAGNIGNYSECTFRVEGTGTFRGNENSNPSQGTKHKLEKVKENRLEVVLPQTKKGEVLHALNAAHPYEEVAYDLYKLENIDQQVGSGMIGKLKREMSEQDFLMHLKEAMKLNNFRHTKRLNKPIRTVAVCGGAGSFLLKKALAAKADIFITSDYKYHEFFDADGKILIADIGHFESETATRALLVELLTEKLTPLNVFLEPSSVNTNPVQYFQN